MVKRLLPWIRGLFGRKRARASFTVENCTVTNSLRLHTFVDQYVDLTGKRVECCTFDGCVVELRALTAPIVSNNFTCCRLVGAGWPARILADNERANGR